MNPRWLLTLSLTCLLVLAVPVTADESALEPLDPRAWDAAKAAHLLNRACFGGTPEEIRKLAAMTPSQAVDYLLSYAKRPAGKPLVLQKFDPKRPDIARAIERGSAKYVRQRMEAAAERARLDLEEALKGGRGKSVDPLKAKEEKASKKATKKKKDKSTKQRGKDEPLESYITRLARRRTTSKVAKSFQGMNCHLLREWWLTRMAATQRPLEEKMTLFWHGHFATGFRTVGNARHMQVQNELFRKHATGSFAALVRGVARDAAMLSYLDGNDNVKKHPNENFARELMELFTFGIGNYTEKDIQESARAFTGWRTKRKGGGFTFRKHDHDFGEKTFLGQTGKWNGDDIIRMILAHPSTAKFITRKLCRFLMCDTPDEALVDELAATFRSGGYETEPVLRKLFTSRAFYEPRHTGSHIKSPVELVVGTVRALGLPPVVAGMAVRVLREMGQDLFQPPNVKGWDGGRAWINSSTLLIRYNFARNLLFNAGELAAEAEQGGMMMERTPEKGKGKLGNKSGRKKLGGNHDDKQPGAKLALLDEVMRLRTPAEVVDRLTSTLLHRKLEEGRVIRLRAVLAPNGERYRPGSASARRRALELILLLTSMPEYQLS